MPTKEPTGPKGPMLISSATRRQAAVLQPKHSRSALLLPGEDPARLKALFAGYYEHFRPTTIVETTLVDEMIAAVWRLNRTVGYESMLLTERAEELIADHRKSYVVADMQRLFAHAAESSSSGLTQINRTIVACRNTFRGALADLEKVRKLKGDPSQPFLPPPMEFSASTNFAEPTVPPKKNVVEMPLPKPQREPAAEAPPPAPEPVSAPPESPKTRHEWFESEDYVPPAPEPEPQPDPPPAFHDINGNPIAIHKQEKPTFSPGDFQLTTSPETAQLLKDLLKPKK